MTCPCGDKSHTSCVTVMKCAYRTASKLQRAAMRSWMERVLNDDDGNDESPKRDSTRGVHPRITTEPKGQR